MRQNPQRFVYATGLVVALLLPHRAGAAEAGPSGDAALRVGAASATITPERPVWMAGFGARKKRSEGKYQDLYVKALAVRDPRGQTAVLLGSDLVAVTANWRGPVLEQVKQRFGLAPEQVLINCSHTHCGPVIDKLFYPEWDPAYTADLIRKTVGVIGKALEDLEEASVSVGRGPCSLSVNRRRPLPDDPAHVDPGLLPNPQGLVDHDVNVLKVERKDGSVKAVLFLYACHPTTMGGYLFGGDYAGFAQKALEAELPGATAIFLQGCGGDLKTRNVGPNGRFKDGPLEVVEGFGRELSQAVLTVLAGRLTPVSGRLVTREATQPLPAQPIPPRPELEARVRAGGWRAEKATEILRALDAKKELPRSHDHIVQVVTIGDTFTLVGLSGEDCVEYALRLKRELGRETWVAGYCNDVSAYIPSARMVPEGGYEVERWLGVGDIPTPFEPRIEDLIVGKVHELVRASRAALAAQP